MNQSTEFEEAKLEVSLRNYIYSRVNDELYPLLSQDPEYIELHGKLTELFRQIANLIPDKLCNDYENIEGRISSKESKFYYYCGLQDGLNIKKLLNGGIAI